VNASIDIKYAFGSSVIPFDGVQTFSAPNTGDKEVRVRVRVSDGRRVRILIRVRIRVRVRVRYWCSNVQCTKYGR
jgi:hypothetical protein